MKTSGFDPSPGHPEVLRSMAVGVGEETLCLLVDLMFAWISRGDSWRLGEHQFVDDIEIAILSQWPFQEPKLPLILVGTVPPPF